MNYHWGFISKTAGEGTVVTRESGDTVSVSFSARSIPWGGRLYSVKGFSGGNPEERPFAFRRCHL